MRVTNFILLTSLFFFQNNYGQYTDVINSNRPGNSMSAFSVGKTVIQLESGVSYIKERHNVLDYNATGFGIDFTGRYGFYKEQLEAIVNFNYQKDTYQTPFLDTKRSGLKTTTIGFKYLAFDPMKNYETKIDMYSWKKNHKYNWHQLIPAVAVYAGFNYNSSSNPFWRTTEKMATLAPKAMVITQNILPGAWVFVTNVFVDQVSSVNQSMGYVVTLTKGFNDQWSGFLENKGIKSDYYSDGIFTVGAAYLFNSDIQIDASISRNYKDTPRLLYGGIGFSWRYDTNYEEVMLRAPKKDKKKDKSTKGKDKEKTKKRLDEVQVEKP
jgi:hypothetical protein